MEAITWLLIGLALLASEWLGASFDGLLPAAVAALLISMLTAVLPLALWPQLLLFGLLTGGLLLAIRRWSKSQKERAIAQSPAAERATVIGGFDHQSSGRVRWQGQSWAAELLETDGGPGPRAGEEVTVLRREGTRLQVLSALSRRTSG